MASRSRSAAVIGSVNARPSGAAVAAGADTTGARSTFVTAIELLDDPVSELLAVNVTGKGPGATSKPGVQLTVPVVLDALVENEAPAGSPEATSDRIVWPSGSAAVTPKLSG